MKPLPWKVYVASILILVILLLLSGCTNNVETEDNVPYNERDDDGDGYLNKVDDYPDNPSYHAKTEIDRIILTTSDSWATFELDPSVPSNIERLIIGAYTSGSDIELELYTITNGRSSMAWKHYYNGMDPQEDHEYIYDLHSNEDFDKVVVTNPSPTSRFGVQVIIYTVQ